MNFNELSDKDKKKLIKDFNNYLKENEKLDRLEKEKKIAEKQQLQITKYLSNKKNRDSAFLDSLESSMFYDDNNNHIQFIKDNYNEEYQLFINDLNTIKEIYSKFK